MYSGIGLILSCILELSDNGTLEVTLSCSIGFSDSFSKALLRGGIGVLICHLKPALPWPNFGLIWGVPFASEVTTGFNTCFSGTIFWSNPLPMPCTSGKCMQLDLACNLVWTKYFPTFFFTYIIILKIVICFACWTKSVWFHVDYYHHVFA